MPVLTDFQVRCEESLVEWLEFRGMEFTSREVVSNGETYIHGSVAGADLEVWIYNDEAEYRTGRTRRNFESGVFRDESERVAMFLRYLQKDLAR